jgi:hypothetical protein
MNRDLAVGAAEREAEGRSAAAPGPVRIWLSAPEPERDGAPRPEPRAWVRSEAGPPPDSGALFSTGEAALVQVWEGGRLTWCRVGGRLLRVQKREKPDYPIAPAMGSEER